VCEIPKRKAVILEWSSPTTALRFISLPGWGNQGSSGVLGAVKQAHGHSCSTHAVCKPQYRAVRTPVYSRIAACVMSVAPIAVTSWLLTNAFPHTFLPQNFLSSQFLVRVLVSVRAITVDDIFPTWARSIQADDTRRWFIGGLVIRSISVKHSRQVIGNLVETVSLGPILISSIYEPLLVFGIGYSCLG
jgi:hypothetical protein